jgi:hypothetical protein
METLNNLELASNKIESCIDSCENILQLNSIYSMMKTFNLRFSNVDFVLTTANIIYLENKLYNKKQLF